ncbi:Diguanylate cyclase [Rhodovastum atsumiense]|nr:diguanylate cyclase [Rhodovastum atsumiense]CAH2599495.1 Diguanylate cyclase [Rhodovastum atsumiense]
MVDASGNLLQHAGSYEDLLEFLNATPIGIIRLRSDGEILLANSMAMQLLAPLAPDGECGDLFRMLGGLFPDLPDRVAAHPQAGPICAQAQLSLPGTRRVLSFGLDRVNADTLMAVVQDVTAQVEQNRRIHADEERFRAIFDNLRDCAICTVDREGRIEAWNRSLERLGGWQPEDVVGASISILFTPGRIGAHRASSLLAKARQNGAAEFEGWGQRKNTDLFWCSTAATALPAEDGEVGGYVLVTRDLTGRKEAEAKLMTLATTDPLTGANNRRTGEKRLNEEFRRWQHYGRNFAVLLVDCDHFKKVNDQYGHETGDAVLCMLVWLCRERTREADVTVRWGGEEFLVLLADTDADKSLMIAERLRESIESRLVENAGQTVRVTVSIGLALPNSGDNRPDDVVRRADVALYEAKRTGRNRVVVA